MADNLWLVALVAFGAGGWVITDVARSIATNWRRRHESEHLAALKQSLVERGMSADEIVRVVEAGRSAEEPSAAANEHLAGLIAQMMKRGKSTEEIERIVHAWHGRTKPNGDLQLAIHERRSLRSETIRPRQAISRQTDSPSSD